MIDLTDKSFGPTLEISSPLLVMFHAEWAGPCNLAMPTFLEAHGRRGNTIQFARFNLDGNPITPERFNIRAVPNFVMFVDQQPVNMIAGAVPLEVLMEMCDAI